MQFSYQAKAGPIKIVEGAIEAENIDQAIKKIEDLGLVPLDVAAVSPAAEEESQKNFASVISFSQRVPLALVVAFTRQMCDLVEASVPLLKALQIAAHEMRHVTFKEVILRMHDSVKDGGTFSTALDHHPMIFSKLYVNMVKAGELSGQLDIVLNRLAQLIEKNYETRQKIRSSLAYPILIVVVGILTVFVLVTFVIPRITVIFEDFNQSLPLVTVLLLQVSHFLSRFWWLVLLVVGSGLLYFRQWVQSAPGKRRFDLWKLKTPALGTFIKNVEIGRLARTLGTLLENGITIIDALKSVQDVVENQILREEIADAVLLITQGLSLSKALGRSSYFPETAISMMAVGEETGKLEKGLYKIADSYERQADDTAKTIVSLLGPLVLVVVVAVIGTVVIAMLLPIFQMNLIVQ